MCERQARPSRTLPIALCVAVLLSSAGYARVIYVDDDANGPGNGTSWANAYRSLQDALADANSREKPIEIRVAQGTYKPDQGAAQKPGDQDATFQLISGVTLNGGYAGLGGADPNASDVAAYPTILSGDLQGDDPETDDFFHYLWKTSDLDNSLTVVTGSGTDQTAVLDGVTVLGGRGPSRLSDMTVWGGAGMLNLRGSPLIVDCRFTENAIRYGIGAGLYNCSGSEPRVIHCTFDRNYARRGAGMANLDSSPTVASCTFKGNGGDGMLNSTNSSPDVALCAFLDNSGSGINNASSSPHVTACTFIGNTGTIGPGTIIAGGSPTVVGCTFAGNVATGGGGAIYSSSAGDLLIVDCFFDANRAWTGGAIYTIGEGSLILRDCILNGNSALTGGGTYSTRTSLTLVRCLLTANASRTYGGAMYIDKVNDHKMPGDKVTVSQCVFSGNRAGIDGGAIADMRGDVEVANCILWSNVPWDVYMQASTLTLSYSDIRGDWPGQGNIDADPCFADPGHWDPNGTPGDPNDDFWMNGDYHLKSQAGRWDPKTQTWVRDDVTSPCIDAGDPMSAIGLEPFPNGGRINMGAYGGTAEASKSYFGGPVCETIIAGDINGDCRVDSADLAILALHWLATAGP